MTQSVKDALADAETLRQGLRGRQRGPVRTRITRALSHAAFNGQDAIGWMESDDFDAVRHLAQAAAHAAFIAVPELRG